MISKDRRALQIPGWFIATIALVVTIGLSTWRMSKVFNDILVEHREHTKIMERLDRRVCRMEDAFRQLGAKLAPDIDCQ